MTGSSVLDGPRSKRIKALEERFGEPIEVTLRRLYYDEELTQLQVARRLRVPRGTVAGWLIRFGINQRALAGSVGKRPAEEVAV